jgi:hypothetical protein
MIRVCEPYVPALVIGEIEIVVAAPALDPVGHPDQRRALDIPADARMQVRRNDGSIDQSSYVHAWLLLVSV